MLSASSSLAFSKGNKLLFTEGASVHKIDQMTGGLGEVLFIDKRAIFLIALDDGFILHYSDQVDGKFYKSKKEVLHRSEKYTNRDFEVVISQNSHPLSHDKVDIKITNLASNTCQAFRCEFKLINTEEINSIEWVSHKSTLVFLNLNLPNEFIEVGCSGVLVAIKEKMYLLYRTKWYELLINELQKEGEFFSIKNRYKNIEVIFNWKTNDLTCFDHSVNEAMSLRGLTKHTFYNEDKIIGFNFVDIVPNSLKK